VVVKKCMRVILHIFKLGKEERVRNYVKHFREKKMKMKMITSTKWFSSKTNKGGGFRTPNNLSAYFQAAQGFSSSATTGNNTSSNKSVKSATANNNNLHAQPKRVPRPLTRTQSINSGSTLLDEKAAENSTGTPVVQERVGKSLVGSNVHGTYNAQRERSLWMRKPLFARPGDAGFTSGIEACNKLEAEALRRDPYQVDFLESLRDVTRSISPLIETTPKLAWVMKQLMEPEKFMTFRVSWKDDENNWRMNRGYCIYYSSALGPFKGPVRYDHRLTHGAMRMLGFEQVLKHALLFDESWGGATGGADLDVSNKSPEELRRFAHAFSKALGESIGQQNDVLYSTNDVEVQTGTFAAVLANEASSLIYGASKLKDKRCIISGSSKKALTIAKRLCKKGALPISFSDSTGFLLDSEGFDVDAVSSLEKLLSNHGRLEDFRHISKTCSFHATDSGKSLWETAKGDVAFPTFFNAEISADDAASLVDSGCKAIFESVDRACSENAVRILMEKQALFVPSKLSLAVPFIDKEDATVESFQTKAKSILDNSIAAAQEAGFSGMNIQAGACIIAFKRLAESDMFKV
jgi:glutamate dehydrogenase (NADP+)